METSPWSNNMKILLVYPKYPDTFWSFTHALKFISKKAAFPPLGLLTVAAMLPSEWEKKLVDMNVDKLDNSDIQWADYVFISAMVVQQESARDVIARCKQCGAKIVAGGPLFTTGYDEFDEIDHLVLGEVEVTLPAFIKDLAEDCAQHHYMSQGWPDLDATPIPLWSLINMKHYSSMSVQYSRGCPHNCEFCDVVVLNGHKPRTKGLAQLIDELEAIYRGGWRGSVFIVDDNFISHKRKLKAEILPAMIEWSRQKGHPFIFYTQVSTNLVDDEELMQLMAEAGFKRVFIGIETPNEESLVECNKIPNKGRDLVDTVKKIQNRGFEVQGGFILGFDSDPVSIFRSQINFIQKSGIVTAMVGLLNAPRGTRLYQRLKKENRLLPSFSGDNTDYSLNFVPKMNYETLLNGYKHVLNTIYSPKQYSERIVTFLKEYRPQQRRKWTFPSIKAGYIKGFLKSMWFLGVRENGRRYYWKLFLSTLLRFPASLPLSISLAVYGYHFRKISGRFSSLPVEIPSGSER